MPSPAWENLDDFLDPDGFAVRATVRLQGGGVRVILGVFDDPYLNAQLGEYEMDTARPRLTCKEADVIGVTRGDVVQIGARSYDVLSTPQPDGTGMALIDMAVQQA